MIKYIYIFKYLYCFTFIYHMLRLLTIQKIYLLIPSSSNYLAIQIK